MTLANSLTNVGPIRIKYDRREEVSVRKPIDIGSLQFERWNAFKKEAITRHGKHLTHEEFAKLLLDCCRRMFNT